ncbi:glycoside hydrolase family 2 protein [Saccharicrinis sp. FJH62]|uniref:glycoside hydrolase family 2 protein n=1 Tax=Saccharicrinis sp. FJH62 TaxID=3344657 RepID=UPI0035D4902B
MKNSILSIITLLLVTSCSQSSRQIDLSGDWQFAMDRNDVGVSEQWFSKNLDETVELPGSMMTNDKGFTPNLHTPWTGSIYDSSFYFNPALAKFRKKGDIKFPFWLTPNKYYKGAAWYRKEVNIPDDWKGKRVVLYLERPHWQTAVWVDNKKSGEQNSLSTPHIFDITNLVQTGVNYITIVVDNRSDKVNVGPDSHSISDHTQGNWNGIVGDMYLEAKSDVFIGDVQLYPDVEKKSVKAVIQIKNTDAEAGEAIIKLQAALIDSNAKPLPEKSESVQLKGDSQVIELNYAMGNNMKLWDEFEPNVYRMHVSLVTGDKTTDNKEITFGMRHIETKDGKIFLNDRPVFFRGTLECGAFPLTGYPPMDVESWKKIFEVCKESGLNHVRFHSNCPPEAAFTAADEIGIYLQPEAASWPNHGTALGKGRPIDDYIIKETDRIFKAYGNHPSFVMWAYCNEPYGAYVPFLDKDLKVRKKEDKRRIYTAACIGKSWSVNPESEYIVRSYPRGLPFKQRPSADFNYDNRIVDESRPYITHEMGQYCVFPDFSEIDEYTGVYKAKNFEMFNDILNDHHMGDQAEDFLMASGKLQALCYKAEIEGQLRSETLDGYQLLGLTDFPGQGSAIIGMLNVFWQEKGYITKEDISSFNGETVPLALFDKFVFKNDETMIIPVEVSHYGQFDLKDVQPEYVITTAVGDTLLKSNFPETNVQTGQLSSIGEISYSLDKIIKATQCRLEVTIGGHKNGWDFWVYPANLSAVQNDEIYYTSTLDKEALKRLEEGGKVLLEANGKVEHGKDVVAYFTPVFWNTSWFKMRPPHTTGFLLQDEHPVFRDFPTSYHSDYQWWEIVNNRQIMNIDSFPPSFRPILQPIDTWFLSRRLAQLFEANVGKGKLMVTTLNIDKNNGPASAQLRNSIVSYMNSAEFMPKDTLSADVITELFEKKDRQKVEMYTKENPDELQPNRTKSKK